MLYGVIMVLQSLIAIQVMVFCVYVSSNQVSACLIKFSATPFSVLCPGNLAHCTGIMLAF